MFENLTSKLQETFRNLTGRGALTEKNIEDAMRAVRIALLEADVNYKIVKEFVNEVRNECLGEVVMKSVTPGQQAIKIVNDNLTELMGETDSPLNLVKSPASIMMVGLHGGGKTTSSAKLANYLTKQGKRVLLVAADVYRPAAIDQLEALGRDLSIPVFSDRSTHDVISIVNQAKHFAEKERRNVTIIDTAGRLQIDQELVQELVLLKKALGPDEILLIADAALGQEAVSVASHFDDALDITGIILTKMDGDARGGAALSMRKITGKPIKFVGVGEKVVDLDVFHPSRMASRILGMGDVVSLVEKAAETISMEEAKKLEQKMLKNKYDLNDFLNQLQQLKKLGGMSVILDMIPGGKQLKGGADIDEGMLKHTEAILSSMTPEERGRPEILGLLSRRQRIAKGCGRPLLEVQQLLKRFQSMRGMMSNYRKLSGMFGGGGSAGGSPPGQGPGAGGGYGHPAKVLSKKAKKAKRKKHKQKRRNR